MFVNGRFVRDQLIGRALSEGYRSILPHGVYPAALLFIDTPLEEVDVNVHPAKTEVRFRRVAAVADAVREAVRSALASAGYVRADVDRAIHRSVTIRLRQMIQWLRCPQAAADIRPLAPEASYAASSTVGVGEYRAAVSRPGSRESSL